MVHESTLLYKYLVIGGVNMLRYRGFTFRYESLMLTIVLLRLSCDGNRVVTGIAVQHVPTIDSSVRYTVKNAYARNAASS